MTASAGIPDKPWRVQFVCCGKDAGTADFETYDDANNCRLDYANSLDGHEKSAIVSHVARDFPVVTLCGSMRFYKHILGKAEELTFQGWIVLSPFVTIAPEFQISGDKLMLDEIHFAKIDKAEAIYVVNPDGYIGESTRREIGYAREQGKRVMFMVCPKCRGRGYVPDFSQGLDPYYGEPRKALCTACQVLPDV